MLRPYGPLLSECPPILKFNRKPFSKAGSYSQQSNRLKIVFCNSWATSYSVCGVKRLSSGPLADMPFGSNQMQMRPG